MSGNLDEEYIDDLDASLTEQGAIARSLGSAELTQLNPPAPISVRPLDSLASVLDIMRAKNIGSVLVENDAGELIGVFTERDVLNRVACNVEDLTAVNVATVMTRNPIVLPCSAPLAHALHLMAIYGMRHLPLIDERGKAVGIVSFRDVVHFIDRYFES
ncbi:MAG: cyclic nucleotide-binding/CBS domain-containing protein [Anaerolineales bacterium]